MKFINPKKIFYFILISPIIVISSHTSFSEELKLTIVHTNDTYGRLLTFDIDGTELGGIARRAYVINKIMNENPENTIVLDAGDALGPYPLSGFDQGKTVVQIMNKIGYSAMTLGNNDFDNGIEALNERITEAKFAVI